MKKHFLLTLILMGYLTITLGNDKLVISTWLHTPAKEVNIPLFSDTENTRGETFDISQLLEFDHIDLEQHFPQIGKPLTSIEGQPYTWEQTFTDSDGYVFVNASDTEKDQVAYMAVYIWAERWINTTLELKSPYMLKAWVNGERIGAKTTVEEEENTVGKVTQELKLERGKHLLVIKTLKPAGKLLDWKLTCNLEMEDPWSISDLDVSLSPDNRKNIMHIMDGTKISSINLSSDGKFYMINYSRSLPPSDQSERWTEIRKLSDQSLVHTFRHASLSRFQWLPQSNQVSYTHNRNGKTTLYLHDVESGEMKKIMEDMEEFRGYRWAPDESYIIYTLRDKGSSTDTDLRQVLGMRDRLPNFRHRNFLYQKDMESGMHRRLTFGNLSSSLQDISPDSKTLLFSHSYPDYTQSPFSRQNMYLLNLEDLSLDTLWADELYGLRAQFSPDGSFLLATGGPSAFAEAGKNVPEGVVVNNYDTQAYIYNLQNGAINPFTREFDPSINSATWHAADNHIYLTATDEDYRRLFRYNVNRERMEQVEIEADFVSSANFARNARTAVITANKVNAPSKHYTVNLRNMRYEVLKDSESEIYQHVEFGEAENWNFTTAEGTEIKGRVYYPPQFDPESNYPVIVYYYAGTSPVSRSFGGRYPFNLWAGNDYLVYVLQPSGAVGFGQEFSAAHVNNWGVTVADEIIEGTRKFLEAHPYADADKIGCAGASYGGFMTMLLMTRTDMFTTAISHAGISSIASYWGEGYWGYGYSAEASAGSFPWNNKELYVEQSPLFHADKITTPLLLLTGDSDTNVPPGESIQMYTALKILGRPVELIKVKGEDHHIITYGKRILWNNAIMAWWNKHLKDQEEWWSEQFPGKNY